MSYGQVLAWETGQDTVEPAKLIAPMLARFMATDRAFARLRCGTAVSGQVSRAALVPEEEGHEAPGSAEPGAETRSP
jgi:hypothetical protein